MFRLKDPALCQQVCTMVLAPYLADTEKARILLPDGTYARASKLAAASRNGSRFNVQEFFIGIAEGREEHGLMHAQLDRFLKLQSSPVFDLLSANWEKIPKQSG